MSDYVVKRQIPLLDEHPLTDEEGRVVDVVDRQRLERIAANNNRRVRETGDLVPIVIGHTVDGLPEDKQPRLVGWARNFKVRRLKRTGRYAIHADHFIRKDRLDLAKDFPRRSVELWTDRDEIDPVSLLGATTPERDLGVVRFSRTSPRRYSRLSPEPDTNMPTEDPTQKTDPTGGDDVVQKVIAALQQSAPWKFLEQLMSEGGPGGEGQPEEGDPPGGGEEPPPEGEGPPPEEGDPFGEGDDLGGEGDYPPGGEDEYPPAEPKQRYAASAPGGSNTCVPAFGEKKRMQRDQHRGQVTRYARALKATQAELQRMKLRYQRAERERDLIQLESEGYLFDRGEELDLVAPLSDVAYGRHLTRVRKRYQRAPLGSFIRTAASGRPATAHGERTREDALAVAEYARSHGVSYEEALEQVRGEQVL